MDDAIAELGLIEDEAIQLDAAALQLAALDHPDVDIGAYVDELTSLTERLAELGDDAHTPANRAAALRQVFAQEHGFGGDRDTYDDPGNADLIRVLERRRGLPVSLTILYVAAARRIGWPADALNTPGHVLARIGSDTAPVLVDPFNGGAVVGQEELASLLAQVLGRSTTPIAEHLEPMTNRAVLVRLLLNQATRAEAKGDAARALTLFDRMTVIAPGIGHPWWDRARLQLARGDIAAARASLSAMLEITRDANLRTQISAALDHLTGAG
jgi:regulator of sirC expression with transglutaminase-like and TPR domain